VGRSETLSDCRIDSCSLSLKSPKSAARYRCGRSANSVRKGEISGFVFDRKNGEPAFDADVSISGVHVALESTAASGNHAYPQANTLWVFIRIPVTSIPPKRS